MQLRPTWAHLWVRRGPLGRPSWARGRQHSLHPVFPLTSPCQKPAGEKGKTPLANRTRGTQLQDPAHLLLLLLLELGPCVRCWGRSESCKNPIPTPVSRGHPAPRLVNVWPDGSGVQFGDPRDQQDPEQGRRRPHSDPPAPREEIIGNVEPGFPPQRGGEATASAPPGEKGFLPGQCSSAQRGFVVPILGELQDPTWKELGRPQDEFPWARRSLMDLRPPQLPSHLA